MLITNKWKRPIYRNADGGGSGGDGSSASASVGADGKATMGDAAASSAASSSAAATVPFNTEAQKAAADWRDGWGDDLKNDPALKDFKTTADLAKSFVETKKKVGQKLGIPGADATPEQRAEFYKALGVPDTEDAYDQSLPENFPEAAKKQFDPEHAKKWAGVFKKHNLTAEQAKGVREEYLKEVSGMLAQLKDDTAKSDADFDKVATETFGDKKESEMAAARTAIEKHTPANLKPYLADLPNSALAVVAATLNGIRKEFGGEDSVGKDDSGSSNQNEGQLRQEMRQLMALPEFSNPFAKGKEEHQRVNDKVREISKQIDALQRGGKK